MESGAALGCNAKQSGHTEGAGFTRANGLAAEISGINSMGCFKRPVRLRWKARFLLLLMRVAFPPVVASEEWDAVIDPENSLSFCFLHDERPAFRLGLAGWGPNWAWVGLDAKEKAQAEQLALRTSFVVQQDAGEVIHVDYEVKQPSPREVSFRYTLMADRDVPLTMLIAGLQSDEKTGRGTLKLHHLRGEPTTMGLPIRGIQEVPETHRAELAFEGMGTVEMTIEPACAVAFDNGMRVKLASEVFRKGLRTVSLTLRFPEKVALRASQADVDHLSKPLAGPEWFPFQPARQVVDGVFDMNSWLEHPAGRHGGVRMSRDGFVFEDGVPVKFWGTNLSYTAPAPEKRIADLTAARFAKYGINAVRMHKFSYAKNEMGIGDLNDSTKMDPEGMDRFDYFAAKLKERGIYFGWSHTFGFHVRPGDRSRLLAYDEIAQNLKGNTYAFIHFAEDVQDLMIEMVVNLLKHRNPYTGKTYAEEPALCFIELQNEDDIFFYTSEQAFRACPTYRKRFQERFADWLRRRYGSEAKLQEAWGEALKSEESLAEATIVPQLNPWFFSADHLPSQTGGNRRRLLDTAAFLHEVQDRFYGRFVRAIREAGYQGPLCGSPWQAPNGVPHYYNLLSDYRVGFIDRHNYFEGGGPNMFASMLTRPGSGYLGSGLQQVADRPFALSEWIHVYPNVYSAEGPAIVAAYGMGLQGWDASYAFQSQARDGLFNDIAGNFPWGVWEVDAPTSLGQYPALARMIYRGDVREGQVISVRRVRPAELAEGVFDFDERIQQDGDVKRFEGSVSPQALAVGRVVVEFSDAKEPSRLPDLRRHAEGSMLKSTTGQLRWQTSGQGYVTVDTPGTKALVGFSEGREHVLGRVRFRIQTPFASVFLTSLERDKDLEMCDRALLSVVARQSNSGFRYFTVDNQVIENGGPPILLEPVKAEVAIEGRPVKAVNVLDHNGRRTDRALPVSNGRFTIDGAKDRTLYYEVVYR